MLSRSEGKGNLFKNISFSDESTFYISGTVNHPTVRYGAWIALMLSLNLSGEPYQKEKFYWSFLPLREIHGNIYLDMLENFAIPQIKRDDNVIFQQNGVPPHWSICIHNCLDEAFLQQMDWLWWYDSLASLISRFNLLYFSLWSYVKNYV